jgi:16S rRNA (guanine966-N2)-methyltransferase
MRVISGQCKGRKLTSIDGNRIRPTSDRVKESIFNILGPKVRDSNILDLFAGTGGLGIEALSRGAEHTTFIDRSCDVIEQNLELCHLDDKAIVFNFDLTQNDFISLLGDQVFDIVFIDPPYGKGYIELLLNNENLHHHLSDNCIIVVEQYFKENLEINNPFLDIYRQKKYSKTLISLLEKS